MQLVDSHCHLDQLDLTSYGNDLSKALAHAQDFGVIHFLCVCITLKDFPTMLEKVVPYTNVSVSVGLHPTELAEDEPLASDIISLGQNSKVVAIGETGLDYYRNPENMEGQKNRFREHITAAKKLQKPLIIHTRQAKEDTIQMMIEENAAEVGGVMHCFTEDWEMAKAALELNFYISISGIVTFRNAEEIQTVAKKVPLDRLLIETDSPYLAPVPNRGKPNEPAYVRYVAEFIAQLRGISVKELAEQTTANFFKLFNIK